MGQAEAYAIQGQGALLIEKIEGSYSNGMTEGFNTKIKLIQRMAYGLRNAHNR